jgi:hypothetical protein
MKHLRVETARQYQREEQVLMLQRVEVISERLALLLAAMSGDPLAPAENVIELRESLAAHYGRTAYLRCQSMGDLIRENLESIRRNVTSPPFSPEMPGETE